MSYFQKNFSTELEKKNLTSTAGVSESWKTVCGKNEHKMIFHCSLEYEKGRNS